jgi:hypothetical protein
MWKDSDNSEAPMRGAVGGEYRNKVDTTASVVASIDDARQRMVACHERLNELAARLEPLVGPELPAPSGAMQGAQAVYRGGSKASAALREVNQGLEALAARLHELYMRLEI